VLENEVLCSRSFRENKLLRINPIDKIHSLSSRSVIEDYRYDIRYFKASALRQKVYLKNQFLTHLDHPDTIDLNSIDQVKDVNRRNDLIIALGAVCAHQFIDDKINSRDNDAHFYEKIISGYQFFRDRLRQNDLATGLKIYSKAIENSSQLHEYWQSVIDSLVEEQMSLS